MDILSAVAAAVQALAAVALAGAVFALIFATRAYTRSIGEMLAALREQAQVITHEAGARARLLEEMQEQHVARPQPIILPQAHAVLGATPHLQMRFHNFGAAPAFQVRSFLMHAEREHLLAAWASNQWPGAGLRDGPQWAAVAKGESRLWDINLTDAGLTAHNAAFVLVAVYEDVSERRFVAGQPYTMDKDDEGHLVALPQETIYPQEWKEMFAGRSVKHD